MFVGRGGFWREKVLREAQFPIDATGRFTDPIHAIQCHQDSVGGEGLARKPQVVLLDAQREIRDRVGQLRQAPKPPKPRWGVVLDQPSAQLRVRLRDVPIDLQDRKPGQSAADRPDQIRVQPVRSGQAELHFGHRDGRQVHEFVAPALDLFHDLGVPVVVSVDPATIDIGIEKVQAAQPSNPAKSCSNMSETPES